MMAYGAALLLILVFTVAAVVFAIVARAIGPDPDLDGPWDPRA